MRSSRRMQHAGKNVAETRRAYAEPQSIHETESRFARVVFEFDRNQSAGVWFAQNALRCFSASRIVDMADPRILAEACGQRASIFTMAIHAHGKRLQPAQDRM